VSRQSAWGLPHRHAWPSGSPHSPSRSPSSGTVRERHPGSSATAADRRVSVRNALRIAGCRARSSSPR
jgi:hypothetical protein